MRMRKGRATILLLFATRAAVFTVRIRVVDNIYLHILAFLLRIPTLGHACCRFLSSYGRTTSWTVNGFPMTHVLFEPADDRLEWNRNSFVGKITAPKELCIHSTDGKYGLRQEVRGDMSRLVALCVVLYVG